MATKTKFIGRKFQCYTTKMKNILLFMSPFIVVGLFLSVRLIFGKEVFYLLMLSTLFIITLSILGSILVDIFGD